MVKILVMLSILAAAAVAGAAEAGKTATAAIIDATGKTVGVAAFTEKQGGVDVTVTVASLPPGLHGIHLHEKGACDPPGFTTAGGHFNPTGKLHGAHNPKGKHAGDLPNLEVKSDGTGQFSATAEGTSLGTGDTSLLREGGTAIVIHANPDDEKTDPTGSSGDRIACGVVTVR